IQLARALTGLTVIATASRPETVEWVKKMGAHHVIDHRQPLAPQVAALGLGAPAFVFSTTHTDRYLADIVDLIAPQGRIALIDDPASLDILPLKRKSLSIHWELMFTRPLFGTADLQRQQEILGEVARLVDAGKISTTRTGSPGASRRAESSARFSSRQAMCGSTSLAIQPASRHPSAAIARAVRRAWLRQPRRMPTTSTTGASSARTRSAWSISPASGAAQPPTP